MINEFLKLKMLGAGEKTAKNFIFDFNGENTVYLCMQTNGEGSIITDKNNKTLLPGNLFIVPQGAQYNLAKGSKSSVFYIALGTESKPDGDTLAYSTDNPLKTEQIFKNIIDIYSSKTYNAEFLCLSGIYNILSSVISGKETGFYDSKSVIAPALDYMFNNMFNPELSLEAACKIAGISRVYFNRTFLQCYNTTPTKFINNIRIEKACYLLNSGIYSREEIAELSGFCNLKYFYTVFKGIKGCTTGQYRKKAKS